MSYRSYPAYKHSGVEWLGEVPEHWDVVPLKWISFCMSGNGLPAEKIQPESAGDANIPVIGGNGLMGYATQASVKDTVLAIGRVGALCGNVHLIHPPAWITDNALVLKPLATRLDSGYLRALLHARNLNELASTTAQPLITGSQVSNQRVVSPPLAEQKAIAAFLDIECARIDTLIERQNRLIELLQEKRQALITQAVTRGLNADVPLKHSGVEWLGEVPEHWIIGALKRNWTVIDCKHRTAEYVDAGVPIVSTTEVKSGYLTLEGSRMTTEADYIAMTDGRRPKRGDIVYSRNASVGSAAYVDTDERFCLGQDVCLITSQRQSQLYLMFQLISTFVLAQLEAAMVGSTFRRINVEALTSFLVCCPPPLEQEEIAQHLKKCTHQVDSLIAKAQRSIELMQERRSALISAAVTGKIDVRKHSEQRTH